MDMLFICKIKDGDIDAFKIIFSIYQPKLHNFIYVKTGSAFYAEEVTQITFMKLWESRNLLKDDILLSTQIFQISKTSLIDVLRKTERERLKLERLFQDGGRQYSDNHSIENYDVGKILQTITAQMPPMRKKVFSLRIKQQLSYKEISAMLSISLKTVNKHMELALPQARSLFKSLMPVLLLLLK
jgi:RNA polymerase sigma-70 factor (ECF subfamily)